MPYYRDVQDALNQTLLWADLRREQGAPVETIVAQLHKAVRDAGSALEHLAPSEKTFRQEPNELDSIQALRPRGMRRLTAKLSREELRSRLMGAWLGRAAGCSLGHPVEGWAVADMERLARTAGIPFPPIDYWPAHPDPEAMRDYLQGGIRTVPVDDDLAYTLLGLLILEEYGPDFTTADVAQAWRKYLPVAHTAEQVALDNLKAGVHASKAAEKNNPYQEWIGADIRSDPWAYAAPAWPERAAEFAYRDAYLSHRRNGIYGAMFFAAAISAAFVVDDPLEALQVGLTEIPKDCRLARDIRWALRSCPKLRDWRAARAAVERRFAGMHPVHTNNNACLTVFGLYLGGGDFTRTIGGTVAMGLDNDCTAATAGSLLGAILSIEGIPPRWWKPFRGKTRSYLRGHEQFTNADIVRRFLHVAAKVI